MRIRRTLGRLLDALSLPGIIRAQVCQERLGIPVEVRVEALFTVISVDKLRLFFDRVSGRFDGIAIEQEDCATAASRPRVAPTLENENR